VGRGARAGGALRESGEIPRTVVISFDPAIVLSVRKIEPTLMTGLLYDGQLENPLERPSPSARGNWWYAEIW